MYLCWEINECRKTLVILGAALIQWIPAKWIVLQLSSKFITQQLHNNHFCSILKTTLILHFCQWASYDALCVLRISVGSLHKIQDMFSLFFVGSNHPISYLLFKHVQATPYSQCCHNCVMLMYQHHPSPTAFQYRICFITLCS